MGAVEGHDKKSNYVITSIIKPNTWEDASLFFFSFINYKQPMNAVKMQRAHAAQTWRYANMKVHTHTYCNGSQSQKQ